jgi:hypothetical protein
MADGDFKLELSEELGRRLKAAAEAAGLSAQAFASALIAQGLGDAWAEANASLADYDRTGDYVDAREALASARTELVARLDRPPL